MRLRQIGDDIADRALLRRRQRVGERRDDAFAQAALGGAAVAGPLPHMRAQQGERELAGEQFVISQPRPRRACRIERVRLLGAMNCAQRAGEIRIMVAREPGRVLPLRQFRDAFERSIDRLAHLVRVQPFGQRIDRVDQRQPGKPFGIDHTVGMQHLQVPVVERRGARHVAQLALGQELFQIILARVEIGDGQRVGVVESIDVVGRARPVRRRRPVALDGDGDSDDRIRPHLAQLRLVAPVDEAGRQVEEQVDDARRLAVARQSRAKSFSSFGPTPGSAERAAKSGLSTFGRIKISTPSSGAPRSGEPEATATTLGLSIASPASRPRNDNADIWRPFSIYPSPGRVRAFGVWSHHDGTIERGPG